MTTTTTTTTTSQQDVNQEWNVMAGEWDDVASGYRDAFCAWLDENEVWSADQDEVVIVDFGCGTGLLTEKLRRSSAKRQFICIDAAPSMIRVLKDKIKAGEWHNDVTPICATLAEYGGDVDDSNAGNDVQQQLNALYGKVDYIFASSVLNFVPSQDMPATMKVLGRLLKPGGMLCHSDWPEEDDAASKEEAADYMSLAKAEHLYQLAGLELERNVLATFNMGGGQTPSVFVGIARKRADS